MRAEQNPCLFPIDQPSNLTRARAWWEQFKRSRRARDLYWLWVFSAAFFAVGLVGDFYAWWDQWGYLGNIVAGATGASFGIPVAATVIQWIVRKESEWTSKRDVVTIAWRTLRSIHRSLAMIDAGSALPIYHQITDALTDFSRLNSDQLGTDYPSHRELSEIFDNYRSTLRQISELRAIDQMGVESESIRNRYRLLSDQVLLRAESLDMVIMSDDLRGRLSRVTSFAYPGRLVTEGNENSPIKPENLNLLIDQAHSKDAQARSKARSEIQTYVSYTILDLHMTQQTLEGMDQAWRVAKEAYEHLSDLKRQFD